MGRPDGTSHQRHDGGPDRPISTPGAHEPARSLANIKILKYQRVLIVPDVDKHSGCHLPPPRIRRSLKQTGTTVLLKPRALKIPGEKKRPLVPQTETCPSETKLRGDLGASSPD